jgi:hypothetical protein
VSSPATKLSVLCCCDVGADAIRQFLGRYGISLEWLAAGSPITGSFWGAPEAGIVAQQVFVRSDTPVHSLLHEVCHIICISPDRRDVVDGNAGSDDLEESAVCYLQVVLADHLRGVGRERLMQDMDTWGYSFRRGSTARWFHEDADDAREWLIREGVLSAAGEAVFRPRAQ